MSIHSGTAGGDSDTLATTTAVQDVDDALRQLVVGVPAQHAARDTLSQATAIVPDRRIRGSVPMEGQDGVFSQSWFPVCLAAEVPPGGVRGFDFLDGRVVVWRDATGRTRVTSAFCPHMGASLEAGDPDSARKFLRSKTLTDAERAKAERLLKAAVQVEIGRGTL